jgi:hypothetical protein
VNIFLKEIDEGIVTDPARSMADRLKLNSRNSSKPPSWKEGVKFIKAVKKIPG